MPQSLRILLIADDPDVIRRIGLGLQRQDSGLILIEGADSLATARRRLGSGAYDLALVDLALGHSDGLHLLSDLREMAPDLAVVALAANGEGPDTAACLALGAQDRLAPEAMDSAGLLDRLQSATARAQAGLSSRRRNHRIAASLGATGDLAWHYAQGEGEVWLAAADPADWQLPAPECRESFDALRSRLHPDDREMILRQLEELVLNGQPWHLDARFKVGGGAYRWCTLRGRSQLDARGTLQHASGVLSDAQRQQKKLRDMEQARRSLRAVFESARVPHAVLDSSGVITDCNQAWAALDDPACHAGAEFAPGRRFIDKPANPEAYGDLDCTGLARGVRQVLGGVADQYSCEYGDGERRWRIAVSPLLNPGIAGAVLSHEEITATRHAEIEQRSHIAALESDLQATSGALFRVGPDFEVRAANARGELLGRAPIVGRDVLKVLPRVDADVVGDALAAVAEGQGLAVRDSRPTDGRVMRWLVSARRDATGNTDGFLVHGVDVSDLATEAVPAAPVAVPAVDVEKSTALKKTLATVEAEREELRAALAATESGREELAEALRASLAAVEAERDTLREELQQVRREAEETRSQAEQARKDADALRREAEEAGEEEGKLAKALEVEQNRHSETLADLSQARQVPVRMRAALERTRSDLRTHLDELVEGAFASLLNVPGDAAAGAEQDDGESS